MVLAGVLEGIACGRYLLQLQSRQEDQRPSNRTRSVLTHTEHAFQLLSRCSHKVLVDLTASADLQQSDHFAG